MSAPGEGQGIADAVVDAGAAAPTLPRPTALEPPLTVASQTGKLKVFVSYSRRDLDVADQIVAALAGLGYTVIIDRVGIHGAEKWEERLGQMILEADTVVFVLTPASAASTVCKWEVDQALLRGKRIVPALGKPLEGAMPHDALRDRNYIYFYSDPSMPGSGWGSGLISLNAALSVDIEWVREHTRLAEMAARWRKEGHNDLLARGSELREFIAWRERRPANAPDLNIDQRAFLQASENDEAARNDAAGRALEERERLVREAEAAAREREEARVAREAEQRRRLRLQRVAGGGFAAVLAAAVVLYTGWSQREARIANDRAREAQQAARSIQEALDKAEVARDEAERQRSEAEEARERASFEGNRAKLHAEQAVEAQKQAEDEREKAREELRKAQIAQSRFLGEKVLEATKAHDTARAVLMLIEAIPLARAAEHPVMREKLLSHLAYHLPTLRHRIFAAHEGAVSAGAMSANSESVITAGKDGTLRLWNTETGAVIRQTTFPYASLVLFSPDGSKVFIGSNQGDARISTPDLNSGFELQRLHSDRIHAASFSPDGSRLVTGSWDQTARIWNANTGEPIAELPHAGLVLSANYSPDGTRILTSSSDKMAWLWDGVLGTKISSFEGHKDWVRSAQFSGDGRRVITASDDRSSIVWDSETRLQSKVLSGHGRRVFSAAFLRDGVGVVTGSDDGTARFWDSDSQVEVARYAYWRMGLGDRDAIVPVLSPDETKLLLQQKDNSLALVERASGGEIAVLHGHKRNLSMASFSRDGRVILSTSVDGTARLWPVETGLAENAMIALAVENVPRCLTNEERDALFLDPEAPDWCYDLAKPPYKPRRFGISGREPDDEQRRKRNLGDVKGVIITRVHAGLPAEAAGLTVGDVVMSINGNAIPTREALRNTLDVLPKSAPASFKIWRDGAALDLSITPLD